MMDLLNLSQPWDCERFPKSKTICYGGGGGGGSVKKVVKNVGKGVTQVSDAVSDRTSSRISFPTSTGDIGIVKTVADKSGYTGSDLDKAGQTIEKAVTGGVKKATKTVDRWADQSGFKDSGKVDYASRFGNFTESVKKGASSTIESIKKDVVNSDIGKATSAGVENIKKEGNKAVNQIKTEAGKLAKGDFSLKNAVTGTVSGASETFKKSDAGKVVKKIAKETGYTGSDADKALQKTEKEVGNIGNQVLDVVNNPGKAVLDLADKGGKYVKRQLGVKVPTGKEALAQGVVSVGKALQKKPTETKAGPGGAVSIGGGRGLGSGAVQGLQGGAGMDTSRARARQNKRKLRIR